MKQTIIGITLCLDKKGQVRQGVEYAIIRREYAKAVKAAGGQPVFLEPSIDPAVAAGLCDGIIISGGEDIDATLYGAVTRDEKSLEPIERTRWELQLIAACDELQKPILGICYGNQLLNVYYGGTLYQDIAEEYGSHLSHGSSTNQATHTVTFTKDFLNFTRGQRIESAARHHQAVKDVAPGFEVVARADDGVIEAIEGKGHIGIQWHAESDGTASTIYGAFVGRCAGRVTIGDVLQQGEPLEPLQG